MRSRRFAHIVGFTRGAAAVMALASGGPAAAVAIGTEQRATVEDFARATGMAPAAMTSRYAATGLVTCAGTDSTAQLTVGAEVITTTAHAFFGRDGRPRGALGDCAFTIRIGGVRQSVPVVADSVKVGARNPYAAEARRDWAVARLARPVSGARPYALDGARGGSDVVLVAQRHRGWGQDGRKAIEKCAVRATGSGSPRELRIDCSAGEGASGAAILKPGANRTMVGIYVGWRSATPGAIAPFSERHYNFGVTIEGDFRASVLAAARRSASSR